MEKCKISYIIINNEIRVNIMYNVMKTVVLPHSFTTSAFISHIKKAFNEFKNKTVLLKLDLPREGKFR